MSRVKIQEEPEIIEEDDEMDLEDEDDMMDPFDALGSFLATEDGETIATALVSLKDSTEKIALSLEMQNKILVKILSAMNKPSTCPCAPAPKAESADA